MATFSQVTAWSARATEDIVVSLAFAVQKLVKILHFLFQTMRQRLVEVQTLLVALIPRILGLGFHQRIHEVFVPGSVEGVVDFLGMVLDVLR